MGICASANRQIVEVTPQNYEDAGIPEAANQVSLFLETLNCPDASISTRQSQVAEPRNTLSEDGTPLERRLSHFLGMSPLKEKTRDLQTTLAGT